MKNLNMQASIARNGDAFSLSIDGKTSAPVILRSFRSRGDVVKSFYEHGFKYFNAFPSGITNLLGVPYSQFGEVWIGDNNYDWDVLKRQIDLFIENAPDGYLSVMAQLDTREWFLKEHPECADSFTELIQTVGWKVWRESAAKWLTALIDKLEEWLPDRIFGVFLMAGGTTEWYTRFDPTGPIGHYSGVPNEIQKQVYREWVKDDTAEIPEYSELHKSVKGFLRNPKEQPEVFRYWRFYNEIVADAICYFADIAKKHTDNHILVGAFYGYLTGVTLPYVNECNYLGIERVLSDKNIDALFCPTSYTCRDFSSTGAFRVAVDSFSLHNKLYYLELDNRTHICRNNEMAQKHWVDKTDFKTFDETRNYVCREVGMVLSKGQGYWWFDMFGGYYQDDQCMELLEKLRVLTQKSYLSGAHQCSEVALLLDVQSIYCIGMDYIMAEPQLEQLSRSGVPWAEYSTDDLEHEDFPFDRIKVFVFANVFYPTKKTKELINKLRSMGKTLIFLHAPGYVTDQGFCEKTMEELTNITLTEAKGVNGTITINNSNFEYHFRDSGSADSISEFSDFEKFEPFFEAKDKDIEILGCYKGTDKAALVKKKNHFGGVDAFSAVAPIPEFVLRDFYKEAGVFVYWDSTDPIYLHEKLICMNSYLGGTHILRWPCEANFIDYFTGEKYNLSPKGTRVEFKPQETKIFIAL